MAGGYEMTLPIVKVVLPADIVNQPNGNLDVSLLVQIHPRGKMHHTATRAWRALVAWAGIQGLPLTFTYGGMYRTYDEQVTLFKQRYTTSYISGQPSKWWNGQWWYLRKDPNTGRSLAGAAVPGTSNHGRGLAIDTAFDKDPLDGLGPDDATAITAHPKFGLFRDNVIRFGFSYEDQSEPWHIRYVAGDKIPQAVLDFEQAILGADGIPVFDPIHGYWGLWPLANKPAAKLGDRGDRIKYLQGVLKIKCGQQSLAIDGVYGLHTELAVRQLQRYFKLSIDGWVGAETWKTIDWLATK